ncbi:MAG: hypothetical protein L0Y58_06910 [Verrucomicrobia subdivision 3 bacterium]|nr:hypothetical protein [Limisphaerales bacterium]
MPDRIADVDDATAYVLGTLRARQRRRFEARLRKSPELQSMVRLLETGSIGLAMAAPRREPPARLWEGIQAAIHHECEKRERAVRRKWLQAAVGIAACAVTGWFAYSLWDQRPLPPKSNLVAGNDLAIAAAGDMNVPSPLLVDTTPQTPRTSNAASEPPDERRGPRPTEGRTLRRRVGDLESEIAHPAQSVAQQQDPPADFNRVTFLEIVPEPGDATIAGQITPPSPELRRALLLGVARQLGWAPAPTAPPAFPPPPIPASTASASSPAPSQPQEPSPPAAQNESRVDFVDLPPVDPPSPESQTASVPAASSLSAATPALSRESSTPRNTTSIPAYTSGTNLVFAINSSVVPIGTQAVMFYSGNGGGPVVYRGTVAVGVSPTVVTMPFVQLRAFTWNNSAPPQAFPGTVTLNTISQGSIAHFQFFVPNSPASSP